LIDNLSIICNSTPSSITDAAWDGINLEYENLTLSLTGAEGRSVTVTDITGRILYRPNATTVEKITLPTSGVFFVRVDDSPARKVIAIR
jgi:hypothetical protein